MTDVKKETGARCGSRFERLQELMSAELAAREADNSKQAGA
jgi:hypothetical protein